jgi:hypothetical protein
MEEDGDDTAICPHCGMDTLLPGVTDVQFLTECFGHWFTKRHEQTAPK